MHFIAPCSPPLEVEKFAATLDPISWGSMMAWFGHTTDDMTLCGTHHNKIGTTRHGKTCFCTGAGWRDVGPDGPWIADGKLPNLARLVRSGTCGPLRSTIHPVTTSAWTSFLTQGRMGGGLGKPFNRSGK